MPFNCRQRVPGTVGPPRRHKENNTIMLLNECEHEGLRRIYGNGNGLFKKGSFTVDVPALDYDMELVV